jgi:hypothetical protein
MLFSTIDSIIDASLAWNKPEAPTTAVKQIEYSGDAEELLPASTLSKIQSIHITGGLGELNVKFGN